MQPQSFNTGLILFSTLRKELLYQQRSIELEMDFIKIIYTILCNLSNEQFLVMLPSGNIEENNSLYSCRCIAIQIDNISK